jgi:Zn-dependent protease
MAAENGVKPDPSLWLPLLGHYRLTALPRDTVLEGRLNEGLTAESDEVLDVLAQWPARAHFATDEEGTGVVLVYQVKEESTRWPWIHLALLLATFITTLGSGALMLNIDPFDTRLLHLSGTSVPYPTTLHFRSLLVGGTFAFPFLGVLMVHEMGHWGAARLHRVRASLPYFIPFPPYLSLIGSLGAFIRLKGPSVRRSILFDIGAAGPLASFLVSVPLLVVGLARSRVVAGPISAPTPFLVRFTGQPVWLGDSVITHALATWFGPGPVGEAPILLHPLALAGWLGLFVTALNLLPLGQLDGGHALYALTPRRHARMARWFLLTLVVLGFAWWGWWAWAGLVFALHRGRVVHPAVIQPGPEPGRLRRGVGWLLIAIFTLSFVVVPIEL